MSEPMLKTPIGANGLDVTRYAGPAGVPRLQLTITAPDPADPGVAVLDPAEVAQLHQALGRYLRSLDT